MIVLPFPFILAEIVIFFIAVNEWGFFNTLGLYLLPCLLGFAIMSLIGRMAFMNLQSAVVKGRLPANKILHSGAIFLSGILFLIPSFFTRIFGLCLLLPGLRHLAVWKFKLFMVEQIKKGSASFGARGFGSQGFRYYGFGNDMGPVEREVHEASGGPVLDVTPLEISHEEKKPRGE